jgi:hypothetical protein
MSRSCFIARNLHPMTIRTCAWQAASHLLLAPIPFSIDREVSKAVSPDDPRTTVVLKKILMDNEIEGVCIQPFPFSLRSLFLWC